MQTFIPGKGAALESTIETMQAKLAERGFKLNESSLLHEVDAIWSTHMKDNDCPMLFSNGKGSCAWAS
ncbi:MAG: 30s ribosomal protein methylthiotransferase accessory protein YcaO [Massilia sp.]|jgi:ribosomal protein S12 methylthiotransferase accessory factor|nr:30s ribosomal protein methylthiotransferase accessory protein YcaO [Massilia sp.]